MSVIINPNVLLNRDALSIQDGAVDSNYQTPMLLPPLTDVKVTAISDGGTANVTALARVFGWFE